MKHIHILGICGTFMGGIAQLAKQAGFKVTGSDKNVYPPMSTQLENAGIHLTEGFDEAQLEQNFDTLVIGNVMRRGMPVIESMLDKRVSYTSGPQWLGDFILRHKWVIAVSGTHGKTTTASMVAWILEYAQMNPGFLIGGVPENFGISARLGGSDFFVIEADEYDTAFFDKRSKFVHYHPQTLIVNNLEFDHADIFEDLYAIQKQFHHVIRIVPKSGLIIHPENSDAVDDTLAMGTYCPLESFGLNSWRAENVDAKTNHFDVLDPEGKRYPLKWNELGEHNRNNALAAIAAARHAGVPVQVAIDALAEFKGIKRRMEVRGIVNNITVYDDFAHHPTAIATTLAGLRAKVGDERIIAVLDPRSNTMRMGIHQSTLATSFDEADEVVILQPDDVDWSVTDILKNISAPAQSFDAVDNICDYLIEHATPHTHLLLMSNGSFSGLHNSVLERLKTQHD